MLNMSVDHGGLTWMLLLLLLLVSGVLCATWKLEFQEQPICAVTGSSVVILCSFYHPDNLRMKTVMWGHVRPRHPQARLIFDSNLRKVAPGFQYLGDRHRSCSLKIHQVTQSDAGKYIVSLNNNRRDAWPGKAGPRLKVVDLKIVVTKTNGTEAVKAGDSVNLTCVNRCDARDASSALNWFKDGKAINGGRVLSLSNVSSANSGNYTCSLKAQAGATSGAINIEVEYAPTNTTASVGPAADLAHWAAFPRDALIAATVALIATTVFAASRLILVTLHVRSCLSVLRRLKTNSTWDQETGRKDTQEEKTEPEGETPGVVYASLNFNNTRKSNTGQQMDRAEDVIYSTVTLSTSHQLLVN